MTDVFINYSAQDRPLANEIANALKQAGLRTWQDQEEIKLGEDFVSVIRDGIGKIWMYRHSVDATFCRLKLVLAEAKLARERGTQLPVAVGIDVRDIPPEFRDVQALTIRSNTINPDELNQLIKAVRSRLADTQTIQHLARAPSEIPKGKTREIAKGKKAFVSYATEDEVFGSNGLPLLDLLPRCRPRRRLQGIDCSCYCRVTNTSFDVATELLLARRRNKRRFVIKTDASEPDGPVEYELATVQWVDGQKDRAKAFETIAERARLF